MNNPYWLVETGTPTEWLEDLRFDYPEWTNDSSKAMRFSNENSCKKFIDSHKLVETANARATEHIDMAPKE